MSISIIDELDLLTLQMSTLEAKKRKLLHELEMTIRNTDIDWIARWKLFQKYPVSEGSSWRENAFDSDFLCAVFEDYANTIELGTSSHYENTVRILLKEVVDENGVIKAHCLKELSSNERVFTEKDVVDGLEEIFNLLVTKIEF